MNVSTSSNIKIAALVSSGQNQRQGAKVAGEGDGQEALKKALEEARLRRKDEDQSLQSQQQKQAATLRTVRGNSTVSTSSKEAKAALDIAKALGLNSSLCKVLLQKEVPADLGERLAAMLEEQSISSIEQSINEPEMKAILGKAVNALNSSDPFGALGVCPKSAHSLISSALGNEENKNTASDFAKAIGKAMGMIQTLMGKSAETAALLAKFEESFESLKALEASNTIKYMQAQQAHYDHEEHKMHALGILKKIFGTIVAAILAAIAAVTGNMGLLSVAVVIVVVTYCPKAMDTICEGFARDILHLKGKAAEAFALYMRVMIALVLTALSGGAGGASMVGSVLSAVGTFAGSFMLTGGAENIANLKVDAEHNCDVYAGNATDAEQKEASHDAQIAGYFLLAISGVCMIGSGVSGLMSGSENSAASTEAPEEVNAEPEANQAAAEDEGAATDEAASTENETEETEREEIDKKAEETKKENAKEMRKRKFLRGARYGVAGAGAADGSVGIAIGALMLTMSGIIKDLITTQGALSMSEASIKVANREIKRDEASDQATTSQGIDAIKNITIDESIAYQHQIVGATAV